MLCWKIFVYLLLFAKCHLKRLWTPLNQISLIDKTIDNFSAVICPKGTFFMRLSLSYYKSAPLYKLWTPLCSALEIKNVDFAGLSLQDEYFCLLFFLRRVVSEE